MDLPESLAGDSRARGTTIDHVQGQDPLLPYTPSTSTVSGLPSLSETFQSWNNKKEVRRDLEFPDSKPPYTPHTRVVPPSAASAARAKTVATWSALCTTIAAAVNMSVMISCLPDAICQMDPLALSFTFVAHHALKMGYQRNKLCFEMGWELRQQFTCMPLSALKFEWESVQQAETSISDSAVEWLDKGHNLPSKTDLMQYIKVHAVALHDAIHDAKPQDIQSEAGNLVALLILLGAYPSNEGAAAIVPTSDESWAHTGSSQEFSTLL